MRQQYVWNMESHHHENGENPKYLDVPGSFQPYIVAGTYFLLLLSEMEAFDAQEL